MKSKFLIDWSASALAAGALLATGGIASAQQAPAPTAPQASNEIIVTATRKDEKVQDVPIAVTALTTQQLEDLQPRTLQDLTGQAPNVFIGMNTAAPGGSAIFIRGLGYADVEKTQNPSVGVVVDGVVIGTNTGQLIDAFDVRQVEVSRGPQGIFFGKNTTAGVISVNRSLPTHDYNLRASAAVGTANEQVYRLIGNVPVGEHAGLKIGGTYRDRDGYIDNVFTGNNDGRRHYAGGTAAFDWDATPWLNMLASYDIIRSQGGGSPVQYGNKLSAKVLGFSAFPNYNPTTGSPWGLQPLQDANGTKDADSYDVDLYNLTFNVKTPIGKLVAQTAYMDTTDSVLQDFDGTCRGVAGCDTRFPPATYPNNPLGGASLNTLRDQDYTQFTEEVRLSGSFNVIDYLVGGYYFKSQTDLQQITNGAVLQRSGEDNDSLSFFGNLDWHVTPRITLSGGVRNIDENKKFHTQYGLVTSPGSIIPTINQKKNWNSTITRYAASWKATDQTLLYVSRSEGFRSGGFSIRGTLSERQASQANCATVGGCPNNNFLTYDPENVTAYEAGVKNSWIDNRLVFNAALFKTDVDGFQNNQIVVTPGYGSGTNTYINNYPKVEVKGLEFELVMKPTFMWTGFKGLTLTGTLGLQDAKIVDGTTDARRVGPTPSLSGTVNYAGQTLNRVPDYNTAFNAAYEHQLGPGDLRLTGSYTYQDDFSLATAFGQADLEPGYSLVDASIAYEVGHYKVTLSGKNLNDTEYRQQSLPSVFFQGWGDPRTWSLEVAADF